MPCHVWYDKAGDDVRPWLVRKHTGETVRAAKVRLGGLVVTAFEPTGFVVLQPGGPRGCVVCDEVTCEEEAPA